VKLFSSLIWIIMQKLTASITSHAKTLKCIFTGYHSFSQSLWLNNWILKTISSHLQTCSHQIWISYWFKQIATCKLFTTSKHSFIVWAFTCKIIRSIIKICWKCMYIPWHWLFVISAKLANGLPLQGNRNHNLTNQPIKLQLQ